jgi:hypothetical protein
MTGAQGFWISIIKNFGPKMFRGLEHLAKEHAKSEAYLEQQTANDPDPEYQSQRAYLAAAKEKATKAARLIGCFITLSIFIVLATCWHDAEQQRAKESQAAAAKAAKTTFWCGQQWNAHDGLWIDDYCKK